MDQAAFFDILRQGLWLSVVLSAPMLAVALAAGIAIGLFQALTSVQEMTLTFVPKVAAILAVFWVGMSFMTEEMVTFFQTRILVLVAGS